MSDPYFANRVLLLHFDGADGSTTITDHSATPHTVTAYFSAEIDTAQSLYGGASLLTALRSNIVITGSPDFVFGTGDFAIEGQQRTTDSDKVLVYHRSSGAVGTWHISMSASGLVQWFYTTSGGSVLLLEGTGGPINTGNWVSWQVSRVSGTLRIFTDGVLRASISDSRNYNYQDAFLYLYSYSFGGFSALIGHSEEFRITKGSGGATANYTPQTEAFSNEGFVHLGYAAAESMLGQPAVLGVSLYSRATAATMLGSPAIFSNLVHGRAVVPSMLDAAVFGFHDFTGLLDPVAPTTYVADLITTGGAVRVPISSWQATLRTDEAQYAQAVIPACTSWLDALAVATEFVVYRRAVLSDDSVMEYEMVRCPVEQMNLYRGSRNHTATITGYFNSSYTVPPAIYERTMTGLRTVSSSSGLRRARCAVDWLLRPGQQTNVDGEELLVDWINYYVGNGDEYFDIGESA